MSQENNSIQEPTLSSNPIKAKIEVEKTWLDITFIWLFGFFVFFIGLFFYFPLEKLAKNILDQTTIKGEVIQYEDFSLSILGSISIKDLLVPLSSNVAGEFTNSVKVGDLSGSISFLKLLFKDELSISTTLNDIKVTFDVAGTPLSLEGGIGTINGLGSQFRKPLIDWIGNISFSFVDILGNYDGEIPVVGQKLGKFLISNITGEVYLQNNRLNIRSLVLESNIAKVYARGYINLSVAGDSSINIELDPSAFFEKYRELNIDVMLKSMNVLQENHKILFICSGVNFHCEPQPTTN